MAAGKHHYHQRRTDSERRNHTRSGANASAPDREDKEEGSDEFCNVLVHVSGLSGLLSVGHHESELQACGEIESVTFNSLADVEIVNPPRVEIEMPFAQFGRIRNDRADAKSVPAKTVKPVGCCASVIRDLLKPALHKTDAEARS